jgi:hypothetical protein
MNQLLKSAQGLYIDKQRIALAALIAIFSITFVLFYSNGIDVIVEEPPILPAGWAEGWSVVASFNTVGFFLAFSVMVFFYAFWSWAFMPAPATAYTIGVLQGVFGPKVKITQSIGKRFKVHLGEDRYILLRCKIKEQGSGDWFVYRLTSHEIMRADKDIIAMRHGMSIRNNRFTTWVSHDELHSRSLLLAKAIAIAS